VRPPREPRHLRNPLIHLLRHELPHHEPLPVTLPVQLSVELPVELPGAPHDLAQAIEPIQLIDLTKTVPAPADKRGSCSEACG
jgi:hypothetical protein